MLFVSEIPENSEQQSIGHYIDEMPSLPISATKALTLCNQPEVSATALTRVVSLDPVLTAQVLRLINSTYYALPTKVESLIRAVVMLGFNTVKNLVVSTIVVRSVRTQGALPSSFADFFWHHSLCVGLLAKALADLSGVLRVDQESYFVAGLLHDLGKIPLCHHDRGLYLKLFKSAEKNNQPMHNAENRYMGIDHNKIGGLIAEKWQLGQRMGQVLSGHHDANQLYGDNNRHLNIVSLADRWVNFVHQHQTHEGFNEDEEAVCLLTHGAICSDQLAALWPKVEKEVANAEVFLHV